MNKSVCLLASLLLMAAPVRASAIAIDQSFEPGLNSTFEAGTDSDVKVA
jgi:hypothetical protein